MHPNLHLPNLRSFSSHEGSGGGTSHRSSKDTTAVTAAETDLSSHLSATLSSSSTYVNNAFLPISSSIRSAASTNNLTSTSPMNTSNANINTSNPLHAGGGLHGAASTNLLAGITSVPHHSTVADQTHRPSLHASASSAELHLKHNYHTVNAAIQSGFHFHLAGFIDPEAG